MAPHMPAADDVVAARPGWVIPLLDDALPGPPVARVRRAGKPRPGGISAVPAPVGPSLWEADASAHTGAEPRGEVT